MTESNLLTFLVKHEKLTGQLSLLVLGDFTFLTESLHYKLRVWSFYQTGRETYKQKDAIGYVLGNVGSKVFRAWPALGSRSQDTLDSVACSDSIYALIHINNAQLLGTPIKTSFILKNKLVIVLMNYLICKMAKKKKVKNAHHMFSEPTVMFSK